MTPENTQLRMVERVEARIKEVTGGKILAACARTHTHTHTHMHARAHFLKNQKTFSKETC